MRKNILLLVSLLVILVIMYAAKAMVIVVFDWVNYPSYEHTMWDMWRLIEPLIYVSPQSIIGMLLLYTVNNFLIKRIIHNKLFAAIVLSVLTVISGLVFFY